MSNYNFRFDLSKLSGFGKATLQGKSGQAKRCIVIPIEENHIFEGEKGTYLDLVAIESNNSQYGDSHFVSRSKSKAEQEQEKQSGERLRLPILGNLKPFGSQVQESEEYSVAGQKQAAPAPQPTTQVFDNDNDLPF